MPSALEQALSFIKGRVSRYPRLKRVLKDIRDAIRRASGFAFLRLSSTSRRDEQGVFRPSATYLGNYTAITRTVWGHRIFVDTRDIGVAVHLITEGTWEMWIAKRFIQSLRDGATVIEIGANVGYYTLLGAERIGPKGRYFAFEANPEIFKLLYSSVDINGFRDRVSLINKAVYSKSGKIQFHVLQRYPGSSSIHGFSRELLEQHCDEVRVIEVDAISLDEYFEGKNATVDLVKMDAEGSEPHIIRGMEQILRKNYAIKLICEFNPLMIAASEEPAVFLNYLKEMGFSFWKIRDPDGALVPMTIPDLLQERHIELYMERVGHQ